MMNLKTPCTISNTFKLRNSDYTISEKDVSRVKGGILKDGKYAWSAYKAELRVFRLSAGNKVATWRFSTSDSNFGIVTETKPAIVNDGVPQVTCVCELPSRGAVSVSAPPQLLIGLDCGSGQGGAVCICDSASASILTTIKLPKPVWSLSVVDGGTCSGGRLLAPSLADTCGVAAVGLAGCGRVLLLDLSRHDPEGPHRSFVLNENCFTVADKFVIRSADGSIRCCLPVYKVDVSCLLYVPCITSLLVGYNFGCFAVWDLKNLCCRYISPMMEQMIPVTHISFQEPSDDPRNFCYIWAVHSTDTGPTEDSSDTSHPVAFMYALCYQWKEWVDGCGFVYEGFKGCSRQYGFEMTSYEEEEFLAAESIACRAVGTSLSRQRRSLGPDDFDDSNSEGELSLCLFVWEILDTDAQSKLRVALFDLDRWYKEEMPSAGHGSYIVVFKLDEVLGHRKESVLDVAIDENSLQPYHSDSGNEEYYRPSALSFVSQILFSCELIGINHPGEQQYVLSHLDKMGPLALLHPAQIYKHCLSIGLRPALFDMPSPSTEVPLEQRRRFLLALALEWQMSGFLYSCAVEWAGGSQSVAGCSLSVLLSWGWEFALVVKKEAIKLCTPLFDHSGMKLDRQGRRTLSMYRNQLSHLARLFKAVLVSTKIPKMFVPESVENQCRALEMASLYFEVVQWFMNAGLLPEFSNEDIINGDILMEDPSYHKLIPYPASVIRNYYEGRRQELGADVSLFVDLMLDKEKTGLLKNMWAADGGSGSYPPTSLQALLQTYLLDVLDTTTKHRIVIYVFLDIVDNLDDRYAGAINYLIKFPAAFYMRPSIIKITQAMWLLDHKDFEEALHMFLDPMISATDMEQWQHRAIARAFMKQGKANLALDYIVCRRVPVDSPDDIRLKVSILLENKKILEAYECMSMYSTDENNKEIMEYFLCECERTSQLDRVLDLKLTTNEENHFIQFLKKMPSPNAESMQILYFLQNYRIIEAFELTKDLEVKSNKEFLNEDSRSLRYKYVERRAKGFPEITQKLTEFCKSKMNPRNFGIFPEPLSVAINHDKSCKSIRYKSSEIQTIIMKAKETWLSDLSLGNDSTVQETPFLFSPCNSQWTIRRPNTSKVVYMTETKCQENQKENFETPVKKRRLDSTSPFGVSHDQSVNQGQSADVHGLLSTPLVRRISEIKSSAAVLSRPTPIQDSSTQQSILKVRLTGRGSISPDKLPLKVSASTTVVNSIDSAPVLSNVEKEKDDLQEEQMEHGSSSKQIRFTIPKDSEHPVNKSASRINSRKRLLRTMKLSSDNISEHENVSESPRPLCFFPKPSRRTPDREIVATIFEESSTGNTNTFLSSSKMSSVDIKMNTNVLDKFTNKSIDERGKCFFPSKQKPSEEETVEDNQDDSFVSASSDVDINDKEGNTEVTNTSSSPKDAHQASSLKWEVSPINPLIVSCERNRKRTYHSSFIENAWTNSRKKLDSWSGCPAPRAPLHLSASRSCAPDESTESEVYFCNNVNIESRRNNKAGSSEIYSVNKQVSEDFKSSKYVEENVLSNFGITSDADGKSADKINKPHKEHPVPTFGESTDKKVKTSPYKQNKENDSITVRHSALAEESSIFSGRSEVRPTCCGDSIQMSKKESVNIIRQDINISFYETGECSSVSPSDVLQSGTAHEILSSDENNSITMPNFAALPKKEKSFTSSDNEICSLLGSELGTNVKETIDETRLLPDETIFIGSCDSSVLAGNNKTPGQNIPSNPESITSMSGKKSLELIDAKVDDVPNVECSKSKRILDVTSILPDDTTYHTSSPSTVESMENTQVSERDISLNSSTDFEKSLSSPECLFIEDSEKIVSNEVKKFNVTSILPDNTMCFSPSCVERKSSVVESESPGTKELQTESSSAQVESNNPCSHISTIDSPTNFHYQKLKSRIVSAEEARNVPCREGSVCRNYTETVNMTSVLPDNTLCFSTSCIENDTAENLQESDNHISVITLEDTTDSTKSSTVSKTAEAKFEMSVNKELQTEDISAIIESNEPAQHHSFTVSVAMGIHGQGTDTNEEGPSEQCDERRGAESKEPGSPGKMADLSEDEDDDDDIEWINEGEDVGVESSDSSSTTSSVEHQVVYVGSDNSEEEEQQPAVFPGPLNEFEGSSIGFDPSVDPEGDTDEEDVFTAPDHVENETNIVETEEVTMLPCGVREEEVDTPSVALPSEVLVETISAGSNGHTGIHINSAVHLDANGASESQDKNEMNQIKVLSKENANENENHDLDLPQNIPVDSIVSDILTTVNDKTISSEQDVNDEENVGFEKHDHQKHTSKSEPPNEEFLATKSKLRKTSSLRSVEDLKKDILVSCDLKEQLADCNTGLDGVNKNKDSFGHGDNLQSVANESLQTIEEDNLTKQELQKEVFTRIQTTCSNEKSDFSKEDTNFSVRKSSCELPSEVGIQKRNRWKKSSSTNLLNSTEEACLTVSESPCNKNLPLSENLNSVVDGVTGPSFPLITEEKDTDLNHKAVLEWMGSPVVTRAGFRRLSSVQSEPPQLEDVSEVKYGNRKRRQKKSSSVIMRSPSTMESASHSSCTMKSLKDQNLDKQIVYEGSHDQPTLQQQMEDYTTERRLTRYQRSLLARGAEMTVRTTERAHKPQHVKGHTDDDSKTVSTSTSRTRTKSRDVSPSLSQASTVQWHQSEGCHQLSSSDHPDDVSVTYSEDSFASSSITASSLLQHSPKSAHSEIIKRRSSRRGSKAAARSSSSVKSLPVLAGDSGRLKNVQKRSKDLAQELGSTSPPTRGHDPANESSSETESSHSVNSRITRSHTRLVGHLQQPTLQPIVEESSPSECSGKRKSDTSPSEKNGQLKRKRLTEEKKVNSAKKKTASSKISERRVIKLRNRLLK